MRPEGATIEGLRRWTRSLAGRILLVMMAAVAGAQSINSVSGAVTDPGGAMIVGAVVMLENTTTKDQQKTTSDSSGFYRFLDVPAGSYQLTARASGFSPYRQKELTVVKCDPIKADIQMALNSASTTVEVSSGSPLIDMDSTELGGTISRTKITSVPLNGRSFTDLLSLQPGVAPISTLLPSAVVMAGVTGSLDPSGDLNPGNLSINGQRESSNGFFVDGIDVQEPMNGGTAVIPNLDAIDEFRVLTSNFDPAYGNYNGGIVTVITKQGGNTLHGDAFEFFRNTNLDARRYFDPIRSAYQQNQFGGAVGGPIRRNKVFFFGDYQGTRTTEGISTGYISVPTLAQRNGYFKNLTGSVSGPYLASLLSQKVGYTVTAGEPYTSVFPGGVIPQRAWSATGKNLLAYIPTPNVNASQYSSSAFAQTVRDSKGSARIDTNTHIGQVSAYYFIDGYRLDNPFPGSVAGATIPGFDALFMGEAQLLSLGENKVLGTNMVSEFHLGYLRDANVIGKPKGGLGASLASQGFITGAGTPGIYIQAPQFEGVENISFPSFVMGVPITNATQVNNTYYLSESLSHVIGSHTLTTGAQFRIDQVNDHPNATFNGTFNIKGTETGNPYADLLIGVASNYTQSSGQPFYLRNRYFGAYGQDSWRARTSFTVNFGLRWDVIMPFWEKYNQIQTWVPGRESTLYPGALPGLLVAGDPGIPKSIAPTSYTDFAPRIGLAYSLGFNHGFWRDVFGSWSQSAIRASYGIFYTAFSGMPAGIMYSVPPFGYNYLSPAPPLMATPFITAATGVNNGQRFPFSFPPHAVSSSHPDTSIDWANFAPLSADPFFYYRNRVPYIEDYMLSIQRQITSSALLTASYVGNQGHHILAVVPANMGDPGLCLNLPGCGPFGEDNNYTNADGRVIYGTRTGQNAGTRLGNTENYGENTADESVANSNYNALEATLRYEHSRSEFLLSYTWAKSIDQGSSLGEQLDPIDPRQSRAISAWDQKHQFVASYSIAVPIEQAFRRSNRLTSNWSLSGIMRFASGFPITLYDNSDNSLRGTLGNGVNNDLLDTPEYLPGPLHINPKGRNGQPAFNTALFPDEGLGQLGNAKRRNFYGPGIENCDLALQKDIALRESRLMEFRAEAFNAFNHAQFYGPASVDGQVEDPNFGHIVSAANPRLVQLAARFEF